MTRDEFNAFCKSLPHTSHVVQWGGADVWKVGGTVDGKTVTKVFAIAGWTKTDTLGITFKTSEIGYEVLKDQPGLRPAPYLASRGMKWIQHFDEPGLDDDDLKSHIKSSHRIVSKGLSKKMQRELNLHQK
ncbi:MmcQ/YjbR family DNA-binding protein [Thalassospira lucentensis]|uniref:MmcQ/YjbR family DNA-binding protein n=1 Tax=Thalassospira lucentensis TaxID=168935 RepID=UPI003AA8301D